jgi:hypothetical protein
MYRQRCRLVTKIDACKSVRLFQYICYKRLLHCENERGEIVRFEMKSKNLERILKETAKTAKCNMLYEIISLLFFLGQLVKLNKYDYCKALQF